MNSLEELVVDIAPSKIWLGRHAQQKLWITKNSLRLAQLSATEARRGEYAELVAARDRIIRSTTA